MLAKLEVGGILWASELGGELHVEGAGLELQLVGRNGAASSKLWDWQGKGVYTIQNPGTSDVARLRDEVFDDSEHLNTVISSLRLYSAGERQNQAILSWSDYDCTQSIDQDIISQLLGVKVARLSDFTAQNGSIAIQTVGFAAAGEGVAAAGIATGIGAGILGSVAVLAVDMVPASIWATYDAPRVYSVGWPGGVTVNPAIPLDNLRR